MSMTFILILSLVCAILLVMDRAQVIFFVILGIVALFILERLTVPLMCKVCYRRACDCVLHEKRRDDE